MGRIDVETLIQILIFVFIFGAGIIQFIYRSFVKPVQEAEKRKRRAAEGGQDPERTLRDFLAELRGEAPSRERAEGAPVADEAERAEAGRAQSRREEVHREEVHREEVRRREARREEERREEEQQEQRREAQDRRDLLWEVVEEAPPPQPPRPVIPPVVREVRRPAAGRPQRAQQAPAPAGPRAKDRRRAPAEDRTARLVREARRSVAEAMAGLSEEQLRDLRAGGLESGVAQHFAEHFAKSLGGAAAALAGEALEVGGGKLEPLGVSLRQAIVSQVVLGPPRAFEPRRLTLAPLRGRRGPLRA